MSKIEVNAVEPQCGTTLTLGASGDTVTIPSGATISNLGTAAGFGSTGEVSWNTTVKTTSFTATSGSGFFVNAAGGAITVTLPASPSAGNVVAVSDYNGSAGTNSITIARNSSNINGAAENLIIDKSNSAIQLVYVDATTGWQSVTTANTTDVTNPFVKATGGTITCCGNFRIHTFTGPGTFTVTSAGTAAGSNTVSYMVVAGGGGGSASAPSSSGAGGAGAGGFRESKAATDVYTASPLNATSGPTYNLPVSAQGYPITVGGGGAAGTTAAVPSPTVLGAKGSNSVFSTITSTGGGRSGAGDCAPAGPGGPSGGPGGSGGGTSNYSGSPGATAGTGNTPPVSPPQGNPGGINGAAGGSYPTGGGGGATAAGDSPNGGPNSDTSRGFGGAGATTSISGSPTAYAGGGGGSFYSSPAQAAGGTGGGGGGGNAPAPNQRPGQAGTTNTGGGGGGGVHGLAGGAGGSGIVIIRYKFQ